MKGKVVIILPVGVEVPDLDNFIFPEDLKKYLDEEIVFVQLPGGSSIHIGEVGVEVLNQMHKKIHEVLNGR